MSAVFNLVPVCDADEDFLNELYAATRAEEMAVVPWSDEQKRTFLNAQFEAQTLYYREQYPNASFDIVKVGGKPIGRFYRAELVDEIRIIDLYLLPEHFDRAIYIKLIETVLLQGDAANKPVQIYLESFSASTEIFASMGFQLIGEHGIYFLWRREFAAA